MLRIRQLAQKRGWNITALHKASGVSYPQTLSLWHNRTRRYDEDTLIRMAKALNVQVWQLYQDAPEPEEQLVKDEF
jgi:transcriptional regulator with XRE-family HTH domain